MLGLGPSAPGYRLYTTSAARHEIWCRCVIIIEFNSGTIKIELDNTM